MRHSIIQSGASDLTSQSVLSLIGTSSASPLTAPTAAVPVHIPAYVPYPYRAHYNVPYYVCVSWCRPRVPACPRRSVPALPHLLLARLSPTCSVQQDGRRGREKKGIASKDDDPNMESRDVTRMDRNFTAVQ